MRLLANENFPREAVEALRHHGHDVVWIRETAPGIADAEVLARAEREGRVLLTFDKDFGQLAFRSHLAASGGIILFRTSMPSPTYVAERAVAALQLRTDWQGHFSVVEDERIRMTPLPDQPG